MGKKDNRRTPTMLRSRAKAKRKARDRRQRAAKYAARTGKSVS